MISGSGKTVPVCVFSPLIRNLLSGLVCTHPGFSLYPNLPPDLPFHLECVCVCVCMCVCVCVCVSVCVLIMRCGRSQLSGSLSSVWFLYVGVLKWSISLL